MAKSQQQQLHREAITREVQDIFSMFRALRQSYDALPDKSGINELNITFHGFAANDHIEGEYFDVARRVALSQGQQDCNSHFPMLSGYQKMLHKWEVSPDKDHLTNADILRIIDV